MRVMMSRRRLITWKSLEMRFGGLNYDNVSGEFTDVPGASPAKKATHEKRRRWSWLRFSFPRVSLPRISFPRVRLPRIDFRPVVRVLGRLLRWVFYPFVKWWEMEREALEEHDWMMAIVWAFPGLLLLGAYKLVFGILLGVAGESLPHSTAESVVLLAVICGLVGYVVFYAKALSLVKMGRLVVYRDWGDFAKSVAWVVLIPLGLGWCLDAQLGFIMRAAGVLAIGLGVCCLGCLFTGAFKCNRGSMAWLSLFARMAVAVLFLFALAKLQEKYDLYKRRRLGVIRGVLIPLVVFAYVFNAFVKPMVGLRYYRAWLG